MKVGSESAEQRRQAKQSKADQVHQLASHDFGKACKHRQDGRKSQNIPDRYPADDMQPRIEFALQCWQANCTMLAST